MRILQAILCLAVVTEIAWSLALNRRRSHQRTKRSVAQRLNCWSVGYSIWSSWGPCVSGINGTLEQTRFRIRRGYSFSSNLCAKKWQYRECDALDVTSNVGTPKDSPRCEFTEWTDWSLCFFTPENTLQRERHRVLQHSTDGSYKCSEVTISDYGQYQDCVNDCTWTAWSACLTYSTSGGEIIQRYREVKSKLHNNITCRQRPLVEYEDCHFCEWAPWEHWSSCDSDATGVFKRTRMRKRIPSNGLDGTKCTLHRDTDAVETEHCSGKSTRSPQQQNSSHTSAKHVSNSE